jgi:uncharacterized membrane protein
MDIGPLEYVVIGVPDQQLTHALASKLSAIQSAGQIRVVDLLHVTKDTAGAVQLTEVSELVEAEPAVYGDIAGNLMGLLTAQDIEQLTGSIPPDHSALVILFEHNWVIGLTETVRAGGGVVFIGGMVAHDALAQLSAELAAAEGEEAQNA